MPFLLLLSALLTALTGAMTGVRPLDVQIARPARTSDNAVVAAVAVRAAAGHRHLLGGIAMPVRFVVARVMAIVPAAAPRLYLDRPRA